MCEENRLCVCNFFVNSTRWHEEGAIIHLNSTIILWYIFWRIRQSSCDTTTDGPQGKISSYYARKCEIMASSSLMSPETGQETFLKAQTAVSEVLGRQHFNTAVFCTSVRRVSWGQSPGAAIFETGERPIFWKEQLKDLKDPFLKIVSYFRRNDF